MLERKQVISFLKILQIPTNKTPEEIQAALTEAGWNQKDAQEAVRILHSDSETANHDTQIKKPQLVAQVSVQPQSEAQPPPEPEAKSKVEPEQKSPFTPTLNVNESNLHASEVPLPKPPLHSVAPTTAPYPPTQTQPATPVSSASTPTTSGVINSGQPAMLNRIFRSDERLSPDTIKSMLGIDIDIAPNEFELRRDRRNASFSFFEFLLIIIVSIMIAIASLGYGMYHFKVGPFHPSVATYSGK